MIGASTNFEDLFEILLLLMPHQPKKYTYVIYLRDILNHLLTFFEKFYLKMDYLLATDLSLQCSWYLSYPLFPSSSEVLFGLVYSIHNNKIMMIHIDLQS